MTLGNRLMDKATPGPASTWHRVGQFIFGRDFQQRRRISMVLTTALMYAAGLMLIAYGVVFGFLDLPRVRLPALLMVLTVALFFIVIRSGLNLRFAEPSLAFPQALVAQTLLGITYSSLGPVHGGLLVFVAMIMFFGMFDMGPRKVRLLMFYSILVMGAAMAFSAHSDPQAYPPALELFYFAMLCTALPAIASLSVQLSTMRDRLRTQKSELVKALSHIEQVATHDELTELANRRHMITLLGEHITRRARSGPGFSVALADIDHFKRVNDTFGHRVGDEALVTFALQARAHLRSDDIIARWGGEEFLLLLPGAPPPGDPNVGVERLRAALATTEASVHAPGLRIAFSAGITEYIDGESIDDMIERADRALYAAKAAGRNRTVLL